MKYRYYEVSLLVLRLVLGFTFLMHGIQKIANFAGILKFFASVGLPAFLPYFTVAVETGAGIFLILGLLTRLASLGIVAIMLGAIFTVKLQAGFINGYELDIIYLTAAVALILSGSHLFSIDNLLQKKLNKN